MSNVIIIKRKAKSLKKEKDNGYIEYKWKLVNVHKHRLMKLTTQMNYRLNEGNGKSMYAIGFDDNGISLGITFIEMKSTLSHLMLAAKELNADIYKFLIFVDENNSYWAKVFIKKKIIQSNLW